MFQHGDLLFTQIGTNSNAISAVTAGYKGARLNHMGIVVQNQWGLFVLEAFPPEVRVTQIDVFLRRSAHPVDARERYIAARVSDKHQGLLPNAINFGLTKRNIPYDQLYLTDSSALYCSELIVDMFKYANGGIEFFVEKPMSFRDLATGDIHPTWIEYYAKFGLAVPQGQPGSNPGDISKDSRIDVYEVQGPPAGYSDA